MTWTCRFARVAEVARGAGGTQSRRHEITAGLVPDPASAVVYELWIDEKLWVLVHPGWEGDPPRF